MIKRLITGLLLLIATPCLAGMDCGKDNIDPGDAVEKNYTIEKIKELCGEPTATKSWDEEFYNKFQGINSERIKKIVTHYTMLTYNRGSNTFIEHLLFKNNILIDLKEDGYGDDQKS